MRPFASFVAIDWSGAKGKRHKGIAIAEARGDAAPRLVRAGHVLSREEVLRWLLRRAAKEPTLFGFDFSFAPPIIERGEYFPGEPDIPKTARALWAYVDAHCDDADLGAASFLEQVHRPHFYFGIADGVKAQFMHFRQCDARLNAQGGRKTASAYDAIGAAQVAKASFSGMRLLHRLLLSPLQDLLRVRTAVVRQLGDDRLGLLAPVQHVNGSVDPGLHCDLLLGRVVCVVDLRPLRVRSIDDGVVVLGSAHPTRLL